MILVVLAQKKASRIICRCHPPVVSALLINSENAYTIHRRSGLIREILDQRAWGREPWAWRFLSLSESGAHPARDRSDRR